MQYQVPQFIEIEDKIFGPLTLKQFIYLGGAGGLCLIFFTLLPIYITIMLAIPVIGAGAALAFYEVNGRPLIVAVEHAFSYITGTKLYLWKQHSAPPKATQSTAPSEALAKEGQMVPKLTESKLKDLAWSLNIKEASAPEEPPQGLAV